MHLKSSLSSEFLYKYFSINILYKYFCINIPLYFLYIDIHLGEKTLHQDTGNIKKVSSLLRL